MKKITINTNNIKDWDSFHSVFKETFGFPDFYGNNINAWIDCMSRLSESNGMTKIFLKENEVLVLELEKVKSFKQRCPEEYDALIDSIAFVNWRNIVEGRPPVIVLAFFE